MGDKYVPRVSDLNAVSKQCAELKGDDYEYCIDVAKKRNSQYNRGSEIYPWVNSNWSYRRFVKNRYDPQRLGLDQSGTFGALSRNIDIGMKEVDALITDANPSADARAGIDDQPLYYYEAATESLNDLVEIRKNREQAYRNNGSDENKQAYENALKTEYAKRNEMSDSNYYANIQRNLSRKINESGGKNTQDIQNTLSIMRDYERSGYVTPTDYARGLNAEMASQTQPYADPFFDKPTTGEHSSSYFMRSGYCKTNIKTEAECKEKGDGYAWIGGKCYSGKYVYLDNSPRLSGGYFDNLKGLVPSTINDIVSLNPSNFVGILKGYSVPGMEIQKCPENKEPFAVSGEGIQKSPKGPQIGKVALVFLGVIVVLIVMLYYPSVRL